MNFSFRKIWQGQQEALLIKLNLPDEIGNDVDGASALILASFEQLFEDLCGVKNALSETRH